LHWPIRQALPRHGVDDFLTAMQFAPQGGEAAQDGVTRGVAFARRIPIVEQNEGSPATS
jgi:hypothetical protein